MSNQANATEKTLLKYRQICEALQTFDAAYGDVGPVAGVDEVGRGCIAGPVVAAAVILQGEDTLWYGIMDSKELSKKRREAMYDRILEGALSVGVGFASVEEIDKYNILHASRLAMGRAVARLSTTPGVTLVDGLYAPLNEEMREITGVPVVDGDAKSLAIAASSIVAKVERDRYMAKIHEIYPAYGFDQHAGYGTKKHLEALSQYGVTPMHRRTFAPVQQRLQMQLEIL